MNRHEFFVKNGYWVEPIPLFSNADLEVYQQSMMKIMDHRYESGREPMPGRNWPNQTDSNGLVQINNAWWAGGAIRQLALNSRLGKIASELLQVNGICMWHDQLLYKPPRSADAPTEGNVGWHQDWNYWRVCDKPDMITAWVALDDVSVENGAMMFVSRSHKWKQAIKASDRTLDMEHTLSQVRIPKGEELNIIHCELKAGCVSFHHAITLHGSGPNLTQQPRIGLAIHMVADHVRYTTTNGASHSNLKVCPREEGELFRGEQHPVIWQKVPYGK